MSTTFFAKYDTHSKGPTRGALEVAHRWNVGNGRIDVDFEPIAVLLRSDVMLYGDDGSCIGLSNLRKQAKDGYIDRRKAERRVTPGFVSWPVSGRRVDRRVHDVATGGRRKREEGRRHYIRRCK